MFNPRGDIYQPPTPARLARAARLTLQRLARSLVALAALLAMSTVSAHPDQGAQITDLRLDQTNSGTRLIIELSDQALYSFQEGIESAVLKLNNAHFKSELLATDLRLPPNSAISKIELFARDANAVRVWFHPSYLAKAERLPANDVHGHRLLLSVQPETPEWLLQPTLTKSDLFTIVIDPGHGGEDPGARLHGVSEKVVVMGMALELQRQLQALPGVRALLTRERDNSVALVERRAFAARNQADLFLSLHANSYPQDQRIQGAIVFSVADRGASSALARMLETRENNSDTFAGLAAVEHSNPHMQRMLAELSLGASRGESEEIGAHILQRLGTITKLHSREVQRANFAVLKSAAVPSLLIEAGFLSNKSEAQRLQRADQQRRYAQAIAAGVSDYLHSRGQLQAQIALADQSKSEKKQTERVADAVSAQAFELPESSYFVHKVRAGDTLSELALEHGLQVDYLRALNRLPTNILLVGQSLKIPRFSLAQLEVRAGDTLSELALQHKVSLPELLAVNGLSSGDKIYRGQQIYIPQANTRYRAYINYQVVRGDSLEAIAKRYGLQSQELAELNNITDSIIYPRQVLKIPANRAPAHFVHSVQWGETLSGIAKKYGSELAEISRLNGIRNGKVYEGDKILIPQRNLSSFTLYEVDQGDTLSDIAERFNLQIAQVKSLNNLERNDLIYSGQRLKIPLPVR